MGDIPSASTNYVTCQLAGISDGTNDYIGAKNVEMEWGYRLIQEPVIGQSDPVIGVGVFSGTISMELLASTDAELHDWITPSNGAIAEKTLTITEIDTQATAQTRTWTVKAKFNRHGRTFRDDEFVRCRVSGVLTTEPTEAVT